MKRDLVVQAVVELELEDGQKLRVDTTVVQTNIHHPTDNALLWDVVRVVTCLIGRLAKALERRRIKGFRDRTRSARRRMQEIKRMTPRQRQDRQTRAYGELIGITEEVIDSARAALRQTGNARGKDMITELAIAQTRKEIEHLVAQDVPRSRRFSSSAFDSCRSWHEPATCGSAATGIVARRINRSPPYMGRLKSSANSCQRRFNCCPSSRPFDFPLTARAGAVDWVHSLVRPAPRAFFRPDR